MAEEKNPETKNKNSTNGSPKKGGSPNLYWIVFGILTLLLVLQNYFEAPSARVSFSYQLEPLVNLELINPAYSRKVATASNLVTFSGRFKESLSDESSKRFAYLQLVDDQHEFSDKIAEVSSKIVQQQPKVVAVAQLFLQISGESVAPVGYQVFDQTFNTPGMKNAVVVDSVPDASFASFRQIEQTTGSAAATIEQLALLVGHLRSPALGIGDESMKKMLREVDADLLNNVSQTVSQTVAATQFEKAKRSIATLLAALNQVTDHVRLNQLRAVRAYKELLDEYVASAQKFDENVVKLEAARDGVQDVIWFFNNEELSTYALEKQDPELYHQWFVTAKEEWSAFNSNKGTHFRAPDQPLNKVLEKTFTSEELAPNYASYLLSLAPVFLILFLLYMAFARQMKGMGGNPMDFGKSPARLYPKGATKVTFKDVAGIEDALEELEEIVEFLKDPQKFTALGGQIPKGVLCVGPPGTGKTLIAKAVAGEADCPFFSISGSDFVEMFVGVGASRIRKMFEEAKKSAPCIIFIDEIDAVGRHRGAGIGGGHDEREQTLNQLLVEMDGFDTNEGIIIIAATNRPDVLDKALLRPGRFDRQVVISLPDIKGRFEILKVHAKKIKLDDSVDLMIIARGTPGCSGADLKNLLNEGALLAARRGKSAVSADEVREARDKVLYGKERRNLQLDAEEKKTTAYHESGHAVVGAFVERADPIEKVTIIPRGFSLGATQFLPKKNRVSYWKKELLDQLAVLMGGRAAEEVYVGDLSSGARQDIERATQVARSMVCEYGMSETLGAISYDERSEGGQYLGMQGFKDKLYSEKTAEEIDREVKELVTNAYNRACSIIREHKGVLEMMTQMLLEFETLDADDVEKIVKQEWNPEVKRAKLQALLAPEAPCANQ